MTPSLKKELTVVVYVGGVTYGEVACLRWLALHSNKEILIITTDMINGDGLINQVL